MRAHSGTHAPPLQRGADQSVQLGVLDPSWMVAECDCPDESDQVTFTLSPGW
jgi:hypothetical protein